MIPVKLNWSKVVKIKDNSVSDDAVEDRENVEIIENNGENPQDNPILMKTEKGAQGLWFDKDNLCFWRRLKIQRFFS